MWDVNVLAAVRTIESTMPMVVYRFLCSLAVGMAYIVAVLAGAGMGFAVGSYGRNPGAFAGVGAFAGFILCAWLIYTFRRYLLHAVHARHLLILAESRDGQTPPTGKAQVDYARQRMDERWPNVSELAQLDGDLRECMRALAFVPGGWADSLSLQLKHPLAVQAVRWLQGVVAASIGDVLLAAVLRPGSGDAWRSGLTAVESAAVQWPGLYKNALWMYGFMYLGWLASFLVIQVPVFNAAASLPVSAGIWPLVFALTLSWVLKAAFFEPIAVAALMEYFLAQQDDSLVADAELMARLSAVDAYRELRSRAA
jgi:hypothetical protein